MTTDDREAHEFYKNPENLVTAGPGQRPLRPAAMNGITSVRFSPETIEAVKAIAHEEGITVSSWIHRLVQREIEAPEMVNVPTPDGDVCVPAAALRDIAAALMPTMIQHGPVDLRIGPAGVQGTDLFSQMPDVAVRERPGDLIEDSGHAGEPKELRSSLDRGVTVVIDPIAQASYARLRKGKVARTIEVTESVMVDVDADDRILGVEVLDGSDWTDALVTLATRGRLTIPRNATH